MEHMPGTLPSDNSAMRTYIIRECLPALSLADLEALLAAVAHRLQVLQEAQERTAFETHCAYLRGLPAGTPVHFVGPTDKDFASCEIVTLGRALRISSTRIEVLDRHDHLWHVPMEWLVGPDETHVLA